MPTPPDPTDPAPSREPTPIIALVADLFFASKVRGAAHAAGIAAQTVSTADAVLEKVQETSPRLVLIDLDHRAVDGAALIRRLKADPSTAGATVIAFAAHVQKEAILAASEAGADRVLARSAFVRELPILVQSVARG